MTVTDVQKATYRLRHAERHRQASREYYKKHGASRHKKQLTPEAKRRYNHQRREKHARERERARFSHEGDQYVRAGISIVGASNVRTDRTVWCGPGFRRERELEKEADKLMNAAELNRAKKERKHQKETTSCKGEPCWCGLCHCMHCQAKREQQGKP